LIETASSTEKSAGGALTLARTFLPATGAIVAPIVAKVGAIVLIMSNDGRNLDALDLPELSTEQLDTLMVGRLKFWAKAPRRVPGWFDAYVINYISDPVEQNRRWPNWLNAIEDLGPELWHVVGARLQAALKLHGVKPGARLIWMPPGALGMVPLGLAQDPASKRRFADDYEIVYAPSLQALAAAQELIATTPPASLAVITNPTGDLPGTEEEGANLPHAA